MVNTDIKIGLTAVYEKETNTDDAYASSNTGVLDYLISTPSIIMMLMNSSTDMLDKLLTDDYITVGKKIELVHEKPALVGETIKMKLKVVDMNTETNTVFLKVEVNDSKGLICSGMYERVIIDRSKLLDIAFKRSPELI